MKALKWFIEKDLDLEHSENDFILLCLKHGKYDLATQFLSKEHHFELLEEELIIYVKNPEKLYPSMFTSCEDLK